MTTRIRRSGTPSATPSSLLHGEVALNYADNKLFWKDASNVIQSFSFASIDAGEIVAPPSSASLLLHFNGANNGTTFTDSSANNRTFTRTGSAVTSTTQSKFGSASGYFNGGYIQTNAYAGVELGSGDFTIELWYYQTVDGMYSGLVGKGAQLSTASDVWSLEFGGAGLIFVPWVATSSAVQCSQPSQNEWHHVAVVRNGTSLALYVDGVVMSAKDFAATIPANASGPLTVGAGWYQPSVRGYYGYIDELRIVKSAVYTSNFTPPTSEFS